MRSDPVTADEIQLLSTLFSYPDVSPSAAVLAGMEAGAEQDGRTKSGNWTVEALQAEYVRLFINALPEVSCPPYGSFYIEGALMGESTVALRSLYLSYGFEVDEMPDHVAVELEFLALLSALSREAPVQKDREALLRHLELWLPPFLDRVERNDETGFYRAASKYTRKVLTGQLDLELNSPP